MYRPDAREHGSLRAFTLIEILIVITIIGFVAGALVVASRGVIDKAHRKYTESLIQRINTSAGLFANDFGYWPPDDWPMQRDLVTLQRSQNPSDIALWPMANMMLRLLYLYPEGQKQYLTVKESETYPPAQVLDYSSVTAGSFEGTRSSNSPKPYILLDGWGRPMYYYCRTTDPIVDPKSGTAFRRSTYPYGRLNNTARISGRAGVTLPARNAKGGDLFSCGTDGLTSINNRTDDDMNGAVDDAPELNMLGEAADDVNNWGSR